MNQRIQSDFFMPSPEEHDEFTGIEELMKAFASEMVNKAMHSARKYRFSIQWNDPAWFDTFHEQLLDHVQKGDPRDVAIYCAFAWHHGWLTCPDQSIEGLEMPPAGTLWRHTTGALYIVVGSGNTEAGRQVKFPTSVWYQNANTGKRYNRPLWRWYGSMTREDTPLSSAQVLEALTLLNRIDAQI